MIATTQGLIKKEKIYMKNIQTEKIHTILNFIIIKLKILL